ncbi:MAG TPA: hypothetical protein VF691_20700 [Cytophagaceae bacterium]|jgi:hypothetical protein
MVKYKGNMSNLLTAISLELGHHVDLKYSEEVLKYFFNVIMRGASVDERIKIISQMPSYLKPFCQKTSQYLGRNEVLFHERRKLLESVMKVLQRFLLPEALSLISATFFSELPAPACLANKHIFIAA